MKKYIAPEIELIRFLESEVLATSTISGPKSAPQIDIDDDGWINFYPTIPTRPNKN